MTKGNKHKDHTHTYLATNNWLTLWNRGFLLLFFFNCFSCFERVGRAKQDSNKYGNRIFLVFIADQLFVVVIEGSHHRYEQPRNPCFLEIWNSRDFTLCGRYLWSVWGARWQLCNFLTFKVTRTVTFYDFLLVCKVTTKEQISKIPCCTCLESIKDVIVLFTCPVCSRENKNSRISWKKCLGERAWTCRGVRGLPTALCSLYIEDVLSSSQLGGLIFLSWL